ncbi:MAG: ABC transporter substrate-binding protein [Usitatibacter sp.]
MTHTFPKSVRIAAVMIAAALALPAAAETTLRWVEGSDADTLDPQVQRSRPSQIITDAVFDTLVKWKDTQLSEIVPDLAESWSLSPDNLKWTFKLRKGVKFHDGTPFNAEAVKFNIEKVLDPKTGSPNRSLFAGIEKVVPVDENTVVFETSKPMATLLEALAGSQGAMASPTAVRKLGKDAARNPVGTGAFVFKEWIPNERIVLARNPDYFGEKAKVDVFHYRPVPEGGARVIELESGNADIVTNIPPEAAARLKSNPKVRLEVMPSTFQIVFEINAARPPFNDVRMRKAINLAVDRKAIVEKILGGYGTVPDGLFPVGVQGRVPQKPWDYNPLEAKRLVKEVFPNGYNEKIVIWATNGRYAKDRAVAEAVQGYLNEIGLQTEFRVWEWASYQKELYLAKPGQGTGKGSNAAHLWMLGTSIQDADWRLRRKVMPGDGANLTGYNNPKVTELMNKAVTTMDYKERMGYYAQVQKIFWEEDAAWLFLFNQVQIIGMNPAVKNLRMYGIEVPILNTVSK